MKNKVLVVGPHRNTRGGITSVMKSHEGTQMWEDWNCKWISTYIDRNAMFKILFFFLGLLQFLVHLPKATVVHIHFSEPTSATRKNIFLLLTKMAKKPVALHLHAFSAETTVLGKKRKLYEKMFKKADLIIVLSTYWKEQVKTIVEDQEKIKVLYNPCPSVKTDSAIKKQNVILYAGTLNQRKGYFDLIEAFSKIAAKHADWKLVFAGNGEIEIASKQCKSLKIEDQVVFKGWISGAEKERLFDSSSIFCLPSYAEGFPMAVLDAWAYGIPVVTTPVGGLPDILEHGENALVFTPGNIASLKDNLAMLMSDAEMRQKLSKASLNLSQEIFNVHTIANQLSELYSTINHK